MLTAARINVGVTAVRINIDFGTCLCGYLYKYGRARLDKATRDEDTLDLMS